MKFTKLINDELIEIKEYAKPNACFQTNEYPDSYDFCILKEQFNLFDLFYDNKKKDKEIERLNNIINRIEYYIKTEIPEEEFVNTEWFVNILDKLKELKESGNNEKKN